MRLYPWDRSALFVYAVAVALQLMWWVVAGQMTGDYRMPGLLPVLFLT